MSDPRYEQRLSDPVERRPDTSGGMWGWIAGIAVVFLIAIILIAGWNSGNNTASNPPATTGQSTSPMTPPSTTGSGPSAQPMSPPSTRSPQPATPRQ
jgi:hypothetical protein